MTSYAAWRPEHVRRLEVTAIMAAPIAMDPHEPLYLDALLHWLVVMATTGHLPADAFALGLLGEPQIPVVTEEHAGVLISRCSEGEMVEPLTAVRYVRRRARLELNLPKIMTNGGRHKSTSVPVQGVLTPAVRWVLDGDAAKLRRLLVAGCSLGRARQGLGQVHAWRIGETQEDPLVWPDGTPRRRIPVVSAEEAATRYRARAHVVSCRPPYWRREGAVLCALPSAAE